RVSASALDRAYEASGSYLGRIWARHRDVGVEDHVRAIVGAIDGDLAARLPADVLAALVDAYARPILAVPPTADDGPSQALRAPRACAWCRSRARRPARSAAGVRMQSCRPWRRCRTRLPASIGNDEKGKPFPSIDRVLGDKRHERRRASRRRTWEGSRVYFRRR